MKHFDLWPGNSRQTRECGQELELGSAGSGDNSRMPAAGDGAADAARGVTRCRLTHRVSILMYVNMHKLARERQCAPGRSRAAICAGVRRFRCTCTSFNVNASPALWMTTRSRATVAAVWSPP